MEESSYIALKRMQVHELEADGSNKLGEDGRPVMRECMPGDPVPEAITWRNLWREVRGGRVGLAGTALTGPALADSMRRQIASGSKKQARRKTTSTTAKKSARKRRRAPSAAERSALHNAGAGDGTEMPDAAPATVEADNPIP